MREPRWQGRKVQMLKLGVRVDTFWKGAIVREAILA